MLNLRGRLEPFSSLVLCVWRAFGRVPAFIVYPLPTTGKVCVPRGHFLKTGEIEKYDILENLVNSCLVEFPLLKDHYLKKKKLRAVFG